MTWESAQRKQWLSRARAYCSFPWTLFSSAIDTRGSAPRYGWGEKAPTRLARFETPASKAMVFREGALRPWVEQPWFEARLDLDITGRAAC
jgi:hypothetical protein